MYVKISKPYLARLYYNDNTYLDVVWFGASDFRYTFKEKAPTNIILQNLYELKGKFKKYLNYKYYKRFSLKNVTGFDLYYGKTFKGGFTFPSYSTWLAGERRVSIVKEIMALENKRQERALHYTRRYNRRESSTYDGISWRYMYADYKSPVNISLDLETSSQVHEIKEMLFNDIKTELLNFHKRNSRYRTENENRTFYVKIFTPMIDDDEEYVMRKLVQRLGRRKPSREYIRKCREAGYAVEREKEDARSEWCLFKKVIIRTPSKVYYEMTGVSVPRFGFAGRKMTDVRLRFAEKMINQLVETLFSSVMKYLNREFASSYEIAGFMIRETFEDR